MVEKDYLINVTNKVVSGVKKNIRKRFKKFWKKVMEQEQGTV